MTLEYVSVGNNGEAINAWRWGRSEDGDGRPIIDRITLQSWPLADGHIATDKPKHRVLSLLIIAKQINLFLHG